MMTVMSIFYALVGSDKVLGHSNSCNCDFNTVCPKKKGYPLKSSASAACSNLNALTP